MPHKGSTRPPNYHSLGKGEEATPPQPPPQPPAPDLSNPLYNGVALSELAAAITSKRPTAESRTEVLLVKGGSSSSSKKQQFVLRGTTLTVKTMVQAVQNVNLAVGVSRAAARCAPRSTGTTQPRSSTGGAGAGSGERRGAAGAAAGQENGYYHYHHCSPRLSVAAASEEPNSTTALSETEAAARERSRDRAMVDDMLEQRGHLGAFRGRLRQPRTSCPAPR